jgi:hypothetical protein
MQLRAWEAGLLCSSAALQHLRRDCTHHDQGARRHRTSITASDHRGSGLLQDRLQARTRCRALCSQQRAASSEQRARPHRSPRLAPMRKPVPVSDQGCHCSPGRPASHAQSPFPRGPDCPDPPRHPRHRRLSLRWSCVCAPHPATAATIGTFRKLGDHTPAFVSITV